MSVELIDEREPQEVWRQKTNSAIDGLNNIASEENIQEVKDRLDVLEGQLLPFAIALG